MISWLVNEVMMTTFLPSKYLAINLTYTPTEIFVQVARILLFVYLFYHIYLHIHQVTTMQLQVMFLQNCEWRKKCDGNSTQNI